MLRRRLLPGQVPSFEVRQPQLSEDISLHAEPQSGNDRL